MNLLICVPGKTQSNNIASQIIKNVITEDKIEIYRKIETLRKSLLKNVHTITAVVIIAETKKDLVQILEFKELLSDKKVILILPDNNKETIKNKRNSKFKIQDH